MRDKDQKQNSFEKSEKYVHGLIEIFQCDKLDIVYYDIYKICWLVCGVEIQSYTHKQLENTDTSVKMDASSIFGMHRPKLAILLKDMAMMMMMKIGIFRKKVTKKWKLNVKMKKEKNGWKDLNLQTADSDDTRNQAKMKFPILKSGLMINIHFPEDREWLATIDAEGEHDDGSGEAAEEVPMVVARPSPTEAEGFDYESDT